MPQTAAERKRKQRDQERAAGVSGLRIKLTYEQKCELRNLYQASQQGETFEEWLTRCLLTGAKFRANSGGVLPAGKKAKGRARQGGEEQGNA